MKVHYKDVMLAYSSDAALSYHI